MRRVIRFGRRRGRRVDGGVLLQFAKNRRPLQLFTRRSLNGADRFAPGRGISFVDQLRDWDLRKIGVAQEFGAIEERSAEGLYREVNRLRRAALHLRQIVALENVE